MALENCTRLGPYEFTAFISAGGMGDVHRAIDTKQVKSIIEEVAST